MKIYKLLNRNYARKDENTLVVVIAKNNKAARALTADITQHSLWLYPALSTCQEVHADKEFLLCTK